MRRSASEIIRSLETRIARLERQAGSEEKEMEALRQTYIEDYGRLHDEDEIDEDGYGVDFEEILGAHHEKHRRGYVLYKSVGEFDNVWIVAQPDSVRPVIWKRFTNPNKAVKWWKKLWEDTTPEQKQRLGWMFTDIKVRDLT